MYSMLKKWLLAVFCQYYKIEYCLLAQLEFLLHWLGGGNGFSRLNKYPGGSFVPSPKCDRSLLALFVAYHPGGVVPLSNRLYLEALQKCGFRIVYIHNGSLPEASIASLSEFCEHVYCRQNIGQDFGAFKDGFIAASEASILDGVEWLLFCNDSNFYLGGKNGEHFIRAFTNELASACNELIVLNENYEYWQHYQAYFLCIRRNIFASRRFSDFWRQYRPLSHRYHAVKAGEVGLSRTVLAGVSAKILYRSSMLLRYFNLIAENPTCFYSSLPQMALYLAPSPVKSGDFDMIQFHRIIALLDHHSPSHVYALIFVNYLQSPFLKKDIIRRGIFSLPQLSSLFDLLRSDLIESEYLDQIFRLYESGGANVSLMRSRRAAFRMGIHVGLVPYVGHGKILKALGLKYP